MRYVLLALAAITPVLYMPGSGGFEAPKSAFLLMVGGIVLFGARVRTMPRHTLLPALALIGYIIIRSYFVTAPNIGWLGSEISNWGAIHWLFWWTIVVWATTVFTNKTDKNRLLAALGVGLIGILLVVAAQKTGLEQISWLLYDDPSRGRSLIGSIGSSGQLGLIIAKIIVMILPVHTRLKKWSIPVWMIFWITVAAASSVVFISKSQTGIALLVIGLVLQILNARQQVSRRGWSGILALIMLLPVVAIVLPIPNIVSERTPSFAARIETWKIAWQGIKRYPVFGVGIEQFPIVYDRYSTTIQKNPTIYTEEHPHSLLIELWVEWGIVGLLLTTWLCYSLLHGPKLDRRHLPALAVWLLAAQTNVMTVTLYVLGMAAIILVRKSPNNPPLTTPVAPWQWLKGGIGVGAILLAAVVGSGGMVYAYTNNQALQRSNEHLFMFAAKIYRASLRWPFPRSYAQLEYAEAYTNDALKYQDFSDSAPVLEAINSVIRSSPTSRNLIIASRITAIWNKKAPNPSTISLHNELLQILDSVTKP